MDVLLQANAALAGFVFQSSLKAAVLIVAVLLAQRFLVRQLSVHGRYLLWLAVVVSLVTPVGFTTLIPQLPAWPAAQTKPVQVMGAAGVQALSSLPITKADGDRSLPLQKNADESLSQPQSNYFTRMSLADSLPLLWLSGVLLFMGVVLVRHHRFARVVRAAAPAGTALQDLLKDCRQQTRCRQQVRLLCSADIEAPLVTGCWRASLILPAGMERQLSETQLRHVLLHELIHVSNHDIAANWVLTLLQALHWFNPLVWIGFSQLRFDRELARDAGTLDCLAAGAGREYGHTLLQLSVPVNRRPQTVGAVGIVDDHAQLRRRIAMIVQGSLTTRFQQVLAAMLLLLFGTLAFSKPTVDSATPASATPVTELSAVSMPTANSADVKVADAPVPAPAGVTGKRTVAAKKVATPTTIVAKAAAENERGDFTAAAAEPVITVALAQTAAPAVVESGVDTAVTVEVKPETWPDWNAIQALAKASAEARGPGVEAITRWNAQAVTCGLSIREALSHYYWRKGCEEIFEAAHNGDINKFWYQCVDFMSTYNRLATNFSRATPSQFTDLAAVRSVMVKNYQTLREFCSPNVRQYPKMLELLRYRNTGVAGGWQQAPWGNDYTDSRGNYIGPFSL